MKFVLCILFVCLYSLSAIAENSLLKDGDTVVILGGTLIERDAHESYIEAAITLANPGKNLKFRNLGWSGDTVKGESRGYFNPDGYKDLLTKTKEAQPTVIILTYGANAAWEGDAGLKSFEGDYKKLIADLKKETGARFIFFTPLKHEKLPAPYPSPDSFNTKVARYADTIKKIAAETSSPVIDLHAKFNFDDKAKLTTNSVHLTEYGYWKLSAVIAEEFGYKPVEPQVTSVDVSGKSQFEISQDVLPFTASPLDGSQSRKLILKGLKPGVHKLKSGGYVIASATADQWAAGVDIEDGQTALLRQKIVEKNETYFHAWRPQNTTYLFFFRKHEQGRNAKDIAEILKHHTERENELFVLKKPGKITYTIEPEQKEEDPTTNSKRKKFVLSPDKEIETFKLPEDLEVSLFAAEPMVINPTNMNWDREGRLWVCCTPNYPQIVPGHLANDYIVVLEDTDKDGKADKRTVFVEGLLIPTAVIPGDGGVYVANSTEFVHYKDTDGDGKADQKKVILSGFGTEDTHHILHTPRWGQDGLLYLNQSIYIHSHVETPYGVKRLMAGGIWQYDPHTEKLEIFSYGLINSWGHYMDKYGQSFATDGAGSHGINYVFPDIYQRTAYRAKHVLDGLNPGQPKHCGFEIVTGTHFPEKYQGLFLANDFRGHRTNVFKVSESGSGFVSKQQPDLIGTAHVGIDRSGKGGGFRPVDVKMGPDGAVYLADWSNIIIQHGEVDFRDERRDQAHGRIWRISAKNRPLAKLPKIVGEPVDKLLEMLSSKERFVVDMAKRELIERGADQLVPKLDKWAASQTSDAEGDYLRLQALWLKQAVNVCDEKLLNQLLRHEDGRIRSAALRVLRYFNDKVPNALDLFKGAVQDSHPRVRLEGLNGLRALKSTEAIEVSMLALSKEMDHFLDYSLKLTLLEQKDLWEGKTSFGGDIAAITYAVSATKSTSALSGLFKAWQDGKIAKEKETEVLTTIASLGSKNELKVLIQAAAGNAMSPETKAVVLKAVNTGSTAKNRPDGDLKELKALLNSGSEKIVVEAAGLAGKWKVKSLLTDLKNLAASDNMKISSAAIDGISGIGGKEASNILSDLVKNGKSNSQKVSALSGLVDVDVNLASSMSADLFNSLTEKDDATSVFDAFIRRNGGSDKLQKALEGKTIPEHVAVSGVRQANISGQNLTGFVAALSQAGKLKPVKQMLTADEMKEMVKAVNTKGNPVIGEQIYRRKSLACINCHAIGGAGPEIGPDLISIGASAPVDYIIDSILQPAKKIKEGYHMTMVATKDGKMISGAEVSAGKKEIVIRDAAGQKHTIQTSNVKKRDIIPMSMMPPGLTASLNNDEFIHLVAFLSNLGKDGDFKLPTNSYLRTLHVTPSDSKLIKSLTTRKPEFLNKYKDFSWTPGYAKVNGFIPLNDGSVINSAPVITRFDLNVTASGKIAIKLSDKSRIHMRDYTGAPVIVQNNNVAFLEYGKGQYPIFMIVYPNQKIEEIRVELIEVEGSQGRAEFK